MTGAAFMTTTWSRCCNLIRRAHTGDAMVPRLLRSASHVLVGNVTAALLNLFAYSLFARQLSLSEFGQLAITLTYCSFFSELLNFQSWPSLIRGSACGADRAQIHALFRLALQVDILCGLAATLLSWSLLPILAPTIGLSDGVIHAAQLYCFALLFNINNVSIATLRSAGRFHILSACRVAGAALRVLAAIATWLMSGHLEQALVALLVVDLTARIIVAALGIAYALAFDYLPRSAHFFLFVRWHASDFWRFSLATNGQSTVRFLSREVDLLIVSAFLGPAAAGLFKAMKHIGLLIGQAVEPLYQVVYPEFVRLVSDRRMTEFAQLFRYMTALASTAAVVVWIVTTSFAGSILSVYGGSKFVEAAPALKIYMLGACLSAASIAISPALMALGLAHHLLGRYALAAATYLVGLPILCANFGLEGAAVGYVAMLLLWCVLGGLALRAQLLR